MFFTIRKSIGLPLAALIVALGCLLLAGGRTARAGGNVQPTNVTAQAYSPGVVYVAWLYGGNVGDLTDPAFTVNNLTTSESQGVNATSATVYGLKANTPYQFRVCANYPTGQVCADPISVMTPKAQASTGSNPLPPIITGNDSGFGSDGNPYIGLYWETASTSDSYDYYEIHYEVMPASGTWQDPGYPVRAPDSGSSGYHQVSGLQPGTTYLFEIQGCSHVIFGLGGNTCDSSSSAYEATTLSFGNASVRPTPIVFGDGSSDTSIAISWSVSPRYNYDHYVIQYQPQAAAGGTAAASMTAQVQGDQANYTADNLIPGTTYSFTVQGCDLILIPTPGVDCATASAPYTAATNAPLVTGGGTLAPPSIILSAPTITAGNSVTVTGSLFPPNDGPVTLGYSYSMTNPGGGESGGSGGGVPVTTVSGQGTFSATLTLPSSIPPASVTISAQSKTAHATATLQVIAPSSKGTLTITDPTNGLTYTAVNFDYAFTLNGASFTPGSVTIFLDSSTGPQLGTATVAADGTFKQNLTIATGQTSVGKHTVVAVQNGAVQASLDVTVFVPEIIH